jgi:hypothetical protein
MSGTTYRSLLKELGRRFEQVEYSYKNKLDWLETENRALRDQLWSLKQLPPRNDQEDELETLKEEIRKQRQVKNIEAIGFESELKALRKKIDGKRCILDKCGGCKWFQKA